MYPTTNINATHFRTKMLECGYGAILPVNGKRVNLDEWSKRGDATEHEVRSWERTRPAEANTGLQTRHFPAFDIDIAFDAQAAQAVEDLIRDELAGRGKIMVRTGQAPKRAILCRTTAPFKKIKIEFDTGFTDLTNGGKPIIEAVEILGDGQQVVCFGEHPETRKPYEWSGGSPAYVPAADIPLITEDDARDIIAKVAAMVARRFAGRYTRRSRRRIEPRLRQLPRWRTRPPMVGLRS